jgi:hypothetical protein
MLNGTSETYNTRLLTRTVIANSNFPCAFFRADSLQITTVSALIYYVLVTDSGVEMRCGSQSNYNCIYMRLAAVSQPASYNSNK